MSLSRSNRAFTLLELLVAVAVLALVGIVLLSITGQASRIWQQGESDNQHRQRARAALDLIGGELKAAAMPLDRTDTRSLQFIINPTGLSAKYQNHDSLFWQAPVATDTSSGNLAAVGYFVAWDGNQGRLCRLLINPSNPNHPFSKPDSWISDEVLTQECPADRASQYRGLFLENVIGIWVVPYNSGGQVILNSGTYDSRLTRKLPAMVKISLVLLDKAHASRLKGPLSSSESENSTDFINKLPEDIRRGASVVSIKITLTTSIEW